MSGYACVSRKNRNENRRTKEALMNSGDAEINE